MPGIETSPTTLIWLSSGDRDSDSARWTMGRLASLREAPMARSISSCSRPAAEGRGISIGVTLMGSGGLLALPRQPQWQLRAVANRVQNRVFGGSRRSPDLLG